jgi:hypothetical protein
VWNKAHHLRAAFALVEGYTGGNRLPTVYACRQRRDHGLQRRAQEVVEPADRTSGTMIPLIPHDWPAKGSPQDMV